MKRLFQTILAIFATSTFFGCDHDTQQPAAEFQERKTSDPKSIEKITYTRLRAQIAKSLMAASKRARRALPKRSILLAVEAVKSTHDFGEPVDPSVAQNLRDAMKIINGRGLLGHNGPVFAIALSPDGRRLATVGKHATVRVWNLENFDPIAPPVVLRGHSGDVKPIAFSQDGKRVLICSKDSSVREWESGSELSTPSTVLEGHTGFVGVLALSRDSKRLVAGSYDGTARVWDLDSDDARNSAIVLRGHAKKITCLALKDTGTRFVTESYDQTVRVWGVGADELGQSATLTDLEKIIDLPIWAMAGTADRRRAGSIPAMEKSLKELGSKAIRTTVFEGANHTQTAIEAWAQEGLLDWLFAQSRKK